MTRLFFLDNKSILYSLDLKAKETIFDYVFKKKERQSLEEKKINNISKNYSGMDDIRNLLPMWEQIFQCNDVTRSNSITNKGIIEDEFTGTSFY